jgi:hypothetical protein
MGLLCAYVCTQDAVGPVRSLPSDAQLRRDVDSLVDSCATVEATRADLWTGAGLEGPLPVEFHPKEVGAGLQPFYSVGPSRAACTPIVPLVFIWFALFRGLPFTPPLHHHT